MKFNELEGVIKQIRYYGVSKSISDVPTYLSSLTKKEVDNILSMEYANKIYLCQSEEEFDYSTIFNNHNLLSSADFKKILYLLLTEFPQMSVHENYRIPKFGEIIFDHISFESFYCILNDHNAWKYNKACGANVATNIEYILNALEQIINDQKDEYLNEEDLRRRLEIIKLMQKLSINETSLKKGSHNYTMEKLQNINDIDKAMAIFDIQCSEKVTDAKVCGKYFDYIEQAKSDKIINYIKTLMFSGKICDEEINMILNAKSEELARVLYLVADRVLYSTEMNKYLDTYLDDMRLISLAKDIDTAQALADVALSLESISKGKEKHNEHMDTIYDSNSSAKAKTYANVILDKEGLYDDFDVILYNAQRYVDGHKEDKELPSHVFNIKRKGNK